MVNIVGKRSLQVFAAIFSLYSMIVLYPTIIEKSRVKKFAN